MTPRHVLLVTAGVATLGLCVYLFVAVNSSASVATSGKDAEPTKVAERKRPARTDDKSDKPAPPDKAQTEDASPAQVGNLQRWPEPRPGEGGPPLDLGKDEVMASANKAYDRGNLEEAIEIAKKVLKDDPGNARMLRVLVSASCILEDPATAQANYLLLAPGSDDRNVMRVRCERYGVKLTET